MHRCTRMILIAIVLLRGVAANAQTLAAPYEVGTWRHFSSAAVSYTFDDNCPNQLAIAVPMFNEYGFPLTLFTVTSPSWQWPANWDGLRAAASKGHEVASHTVSHPSYSSLSDSAQQYESSASQNTINAQIAGNRCVTFAYPFCNLGNNGLMQRYYLAARGCSGVVEGRTPSDFMNISSIICGTQGAVKTSADFNARANSAAKTNGWVVYLFHGINGTEPGAYSPIAADTIRTSLEYLRSNKDKFWVATFGDAARYARERDCLTLTELSVQDTSIALRLTDTLDNALYQVPVTIRRPLPAGWNSALAQQNGKSIPTSIVESNAVKYVMFDAVPDGGTVLLVKSNSTDLGVRDGALPMKWVGTWSTAPQLVETRNNPPEPGLSNNTLRQIVRVSIGGDSVRLRFSNDFSMGPITMHAVHIALSKGGSAIDAGTDKALLFDGKAEVTIPAGAAVTSDPLHFALAPRTDVAITIYYGTTRADITGHPGSRTTSYLIQGNAVAKEELSPAVTTDHWYTINAIDVLAPSSAASVAILGNSITDGRGSITNMQNRWPDIFSETLLKNPATRQVGVLNLGIGGNCVLAGGLGPTGASRFDRDILNQAGVRWIVVYEGVNDIGGVKSDSAAVSVANHLIAAYKQMIVKAHARNLTIYGATIMPFKGNGYYNQYSEACRTRVNEWIHTAGNFDGCIDFDKSLRSPTDSTQIVSSFQNDGLHPDAAGYVTMGHFIDLKLFTPAEAPSGGSSSGMMKKKK